MDNLDDPYIHRLSEELHDLSILSEEIKKQNEYLSRLSQKRKQNHDCSLVTSLTTNRTRTRSPKTADTLSCVNSAVSSGSVKCANTRLSGVNVKIEESHDDAGKIETRSTIGNGSSSSESFDSSEKGALNFAEI